MTATAAVAMSGGVDSSVAAWLLSRSGEARAGLSMLLWEGRYQDARGRCCGALDVDDARRVASQCGLPHYTISLTEIFRQTVVDDFVGEYLAGRTPNPCTRCNTWVKFGPLLAKAREIGAERLATGHYARIVAGEDGPELHRAACREKDQSYFLFELTRRQLAASIFPLGEMSKDEVRSVARSAGLAAAEKGESMEVCFVADGVEAFVAGQVAAHPEHFAAAATGGARVVDAAGRRLGRAGPYYRYTVGQRRGLGVSAEERLYVLRVDAEANEVVVGGRDELASSGLVGERPHWIGPTPTEPFEAEVRIRARHPGVWSRIEPRGDGRVVIEFASRQYGVAAGQAAVVYLGDRVLGGCWIASGRPAT